MEKVTPPALLAIYEEWAAECDVVQEWFGVYKHLVKLALASDPACAVPQFLDWALTATRVRILCKMMWENKPDQDCTLEEALARMRAIHEEAVARFSRYQSWPSSDEFETSGFRWVHEDRAVGCGNAVLDIKALSEMPRPFRSSDFFLASSDCNLENFPPPTEERLSALRAAGDIVTRTRCPMRCKPDDWTPERFTCAYLQ